MQSLLELQVLVLGRLAFGQNGETWVVLGLWYCLRCPGEWREHLKIWGCRGLGLLHVPLCARTCTHTHTGIWTGNSLEVGIRGCWVLCAGGALITAWWYPSWWEDRISLSSRCPEGHLGRNLGRCGSRRGLWMLVEEMVSVQVQPHCEPTLYCWSENPVGVRGCG